MPLLMVLIFAGRWSTRWSPHGSTVVLAALAYGLIGVFPMGFNSFGLDGTGAQTYFFTPVRLREVLMGKNVLCAGLAIAETFAILAVLSYSAKAPSPLVILDGVLWMVTTLLVELTVGNYMSIRSPRLDRSGTDGAEAGTASECVPQHGDRAGFRVGGCAGDVPGGAGKPGLDCALRVCVYGRCSGVGLPREPEQVGRVRMAASRRAVRGVAAEGLSYSFATPMTLSMRPV